MDDRTKVVPQPAFPTGGSLMPAPKGMERQAKLRRLFPTVHYLRAHAQKRTTAFGYEAVDGGAGRDLGIDRNASSLDRIEMVPRYGIDKGTLDMSVDLFGKRYAAPFGVAPARLDVRTLCLARETLGQLHGMADFAFGMQGLGSGPISQFGSEALKRRYLPRVASGDAIAAFEISEAAAGSDVSSMRTSARRDGPDLLINGRKTWISNAGIAEFYIVFARLEGEERGFIAVVVDADNPGLRVSERILVNAPHPLGTIDLTDCRVPATSIVGEPGKGMRVALGTLDIFRSTVGAASLGFARRARQIEGQSMAGGRPPLLFVSL
jgi:hypothetical protein